MKQVQIIHTGGFYRIKTEKQEHCFIKESDAVNYKDFLENGLKVVNKTGNTIYFNNGAIGNLIKIIKDNTYKLVIHNRNKTITSEKLTNKYKIVAGIK